MQLVRTLINYAYSKIDALKIVFNDPTLQIKDAGHAVMDQYPAEIGKILNTFLSTTGQSN